MSKNRNTFSGTDPLDDLANEEYDMLPDSTKDLLDGFKDFDYDACVGCPKSQHSVENKLTAYKLTADTLDRSQVYNCGHCNYNKYNKQTTKK